MWTCENCGETHTDNFTACWNCGDSRFDDDESPPPHDETVPALAESPAEPVQFTLATALWIMAAFSLCCAVVVWSGDPFVLPVLTAVVLSRAIFSRGPRRLMRIAISSGVGGTVTVLACVAGYDAEFGVLPSRSSFIEFILFTAPLNALRCYAASGTLAYLLSFSMLKLFAPARQNLISLTVTLVVIIFASVFIAVVMGFVHFPMGEHH